MASDRSRGGHRRADQMGAAAFALPAFEVAVARARTTLTRRENVGIHAQAHAAASFAPVETGLLENAIEAFFFGLLFDLAAARHDHRIDALGNVIAAHDRRG